MTCPTFAILTSEPVGFSTGRAQKRVDEEGCGATIGAVVEHHLKRGLPEISISSHSEFDRGINAQDIINQIEDVEMEVLCKEIDEEGCGAFFAAIKEISGNG